ncbi:cytidine deaminase [Streptomyces sp. DSM 44915]|uniref:Cytidine deaminase n=1 Tax=Streptomyces chisholmiae TaxID=3075540 RepID=A0ABU2JMA1_9ACTN|nr:cytidine deaminase [Streptomyces sp. DSM 44915]MDT0266105.1 cytidine deaminase [Streptomyces sp. DSM 44915]
MADGDRKTLRLALFGKPGAGKSTTAGILEKALREAGQRVAVVRIAAPLYDVQEFFHARAGAPLRKGQQDGALLNFLGSHFRRTASGFLLEDFAERCALTAFGGVDVILCDDARPADLGGLAEQGFHLVRISAPDAVRRQRKAGRGDATAGQDDHPTELGVDGAVADTELDNSGTLGELESSVTAFVAALKDPGFVGADRAGPDERALAVRALVRHAERTITPRYVEGRHQIGAVVLSGDGRLFTGVHLEAMVGRASICAEAVALGQACLAGATDLRAVVAVRHPKPSEDHDEVRLVPPCGLCRELLLDYGAEIEVVVDSGGTPVLRPLAGLLPHKYRGTKWAVPAGSSAG